MKTSSCARAVLLAATAATTIAVAGCGGSNPDVEASGTVAAGQGEHAGHSMQGMDMGSSTTPSKAEQQSSTMTMAMQKLGTAQKGDEAVELDLMDPVTFSVYEGEKLVKHAPSKGQNAHLMLLLSDARTQDRLPDATVTATITDQAGKVVSSGPQYPMIGMGMGVHYGDNISLPGPGRYTAKLVVGPPRIGRHADTVGRWNRTTSMSIPFTWKGATAR